eukprot:10226281-Lingulodinium_polyedra.AAC.1
MRHPRCNCREVWGSLSGEWHAHVSGLRAAFVFSPCRVAGPSASQVSPGCSCLLRGCASCSTQHQGR